jgi:hypothetical protein
MSCQCPPAAAAQRSALDIDVGAGPRPARRGRLAPVVTAGMS